MTQGTFLSLNSDESTMSRNSGLLWAIQTSSSFFGNLFVYGLFKDLEAGLKTTKFCVVRETNFKFSKTNISHYKNIEQYTSPIEATTRIMVLPKNLFVIINIFAGDSFTSFLILY
jgi:hypothetical protein